MALPNIPAKSLVVLTLEPGSHENCGRLARTRAALGVAAERCLRIWDLGAGEHEGEFDAGGGCSCAEVDYCDGGEGVLVKGMRFICCTVCCVLLYVVNIEGFGVGVLSKPLGARAGKISLPFSAERPIMKTGMPASFFLLSVESVMLRFWKV
jgi:hypothetical protein